MKHTVKLVSLLLALVMILSLATTAFAAGSDGSITISNATVGESYSVYKVFDLSYSGAAVAYSYTKSGQADALFSALQASGSPFTLTSTTTENVYNVSLKTGKTDADVSSFLKTNEALLTRAAGPTAAVTNEVKFESLPYGYYYITSSLGSVVTLDSAKKDVTVIDKNQTPGWDPEDQSAAMGKFVATASDGVYGKTSTAAIGDTAYFKVNTYAPKYAGDKLVADYIFTDVMCDGFTYNGDLAVALEGETLTAGTDYTVSVAGQKLTLVIHAGTIADYPVEAHLTITCSALVDKDAVYDNVNTVNMGWTVYPNDPDTARPDPTGTPYDPNDPLNPSTDPKDPANPPESKTDTYVFGFAIQKYREAVAEENKLGGARFRLYDAASDGTEIPVVKVSDGVYRVAETDETGVEIEAGAAKIFGLDARTYYLEETAAPAGFNLLTQRVAVSISADTADQTDGIQNSTTNIINNAGTLLPSTGGMGTTLFYVIGGLLAACAGILLVVKKRMKHMVS